LPVTSPQAAQRPRPDQAPAKPDHHTNPPRDALEKVNRPPPQSNTINALPTISNLNNCSTFLEQ